MKRKNRIYKIVRLARVVFLNYFVRHTVKTRKFSIFMIGNKQKDQFNVGSI